MATVKRELPVIIDDLRGKVDLMDLRPSVIGQALNIFTRYSKVLDADGTAMRPHMASRIIEQEIDTILATFSGADHNKHEGEEESFNGREY